MQSKLLKAERFVDMRTGINYRYIVSDTEYFRPHYHDYFEIFIMLDGKAIHKVNGSDFSVEKGSVVFIRPSDTHDYVNTGNKLFSMVNITFTFDTFKDITDFLGLGFPMQKLLSAKFPPQVHIPKSEFNRITSKLTGIGAIDNSDFETLKTQLRIFVFEILTNHFNDFDILDTDMPLWLYKTCDEMRKNGNFTFGISKMVEISGKTREHLLRSLKKYTGKTASQFINELRLKFIANMLKNSNHLISDIVYESGFNNLCHASRLFKEKYDKTMTEYREN